MTGASRSDLHLRDSALAVQDITKIPINHLAGRARLPVDSKAMDATQDPVVAAYRERISAVDDEILDAVNRRVTLVAELHRHKREQGYPMRDPAREQTLIEKLNTTNTGPLSEQRLADLYRLLLEICTSEAARLADQPT
jgi:chorismate mutase